MKNKCVFHVTWLLMLVAFLVGGRLAVASAAGEPVSKTGVTVTVKPLDKKYFLDNRMQVEFSYRVTRPQGEGTAEVSLHNVDSGESFTKTIPVEFMLGEHAAWAAWGGTAPWTSSRESEFDLLLDGDDVQDEGVPDGFYIPQVTIKDASGAILAEMKHSSDEINYLRATGGIAQKVDRVSVEKIAAQTKSWLMELVGLEEKARAAGADTSLPRLMITAMRETINQQPGRLSGLDYDVVVANHGYCTQQVPKTRAQLEALIQNPDSGSSVDIFPRPKERLTFKDGYFYDEEDPVFLMGMCMFALWPDLDQMRAMNFNLVHIGVSVDALFPDPETEAASGELLLADGSPKYKLLDFLNKCSELGIKVDLGLTARPPKWLFEKYPDARLKGQSVAGFIPWDIEHPDTLAWVEKYFEATMKQVANHPALNSIWLANEPTMINNGPISESLFREEMQKKYGTIAKLNTAWGVSLNDFQDITLPIRASAGQGTTDFWWFNLGRLTNFFEFMQQCVRRYDKTVNTCYKLNNLQMGWYCPPMNVDQEAVSDLGEIIGMDSGTFPFAQPYYDWLRSLSPEKPVVNLEFKGGGTRTKLDMWKAAFMGVAGIDWWCWHPKTTFSSAMAYTYALHEGSLAMYNIQRNIDIVMAFQTFPRSPFVVVYPDPVLPRASNYFQVHTPTVNAIRHLGYNVDYATEKRIAEGRLDAFTYDFIVLPAANHIDDATFKSVGEFVEKGGKAIVVGDLPELGPMGERRDLGWLQAPEDVEPGVAGCTNSTTFAYGKGAVWTLPAAKQEELQPWIEAIAGKVLPPRPVVIEDGFGYGTIPWKNEQGEACFVTYILNEWSAGEDRPVKATFSTPVRDAVDLITDEQLDVENITIPPYGARLIQWIPES